jgi:predicted transcriptional regulator
MASEHFGYVSGNPARVKILNLISSRRKGLTVDQVRKSVRLPEPTVKNSLAEMDERGLLKLSEGVYVITDAGEKVARELQSLQ